MMRFMPSLITKRCCTCHRDLEPSLFSKNRANADGLAHCCKSCTRAAYHTRYKERALSTMAEYRRTNKDALKQRYAAYRLANKDAIRQWHRLNYKKIRQKRLAYMADYYQKNKDACDAYRRAWKELNRDKQRAYVKRCMDNNPSARKATQKRWADRLTDAFVRQMIMRRLPTKSLVKSPDIPAAMIEAKRIHLKLQRAIRLLLKNDPHGLEIQMNAYSIGDLLTEISNANHMRRNTRNVSRGHDRSSGKKD